MTRKEPRKLHGLPDNQGPDLAVWLGDKVVYGDITTREVTTANVVARASCESMAAAKQAERDKEEVYGNHLKSFYPLVFETGGAVNKKFVDFCGMIAKNSMEAFHQSISVSLSYTVKSTTAFLVKATQLYFRKLQAENARDILRKAHERRDSVRSFLSSSRRTFRPP